MIDLTEGRLRELRDAGSAEAAAELAQRDEVSNRSHNARDWNGYYAGVAQRERDRTCRRGFVFRWDSESGVSGATCRAEDKSWSGMWYFSAKWYHSGSPDWRQYSMADDQIADRVTPIVSRR